jgi:hypothetical protein
MSNVRSYTTDQLLDRVEELKSFKTIPLGYWIVGVRSNEDAPNKYDDKFYLFNGEQFVKVVTGTTNPGTPILEGGYLKYNKVGAAVVKSNEWYYDVWAYGLHQGKMPALRQVGNFIVYRDGDRDGKSEEIGIPIKGNGYGINFHSISNDLSVKKIGENIGGWSAGCQVCNNVEQYSMIINMIKNQNRVTYCLLEEF